MSGNRRIRDILEGGQIWARILFAGEGAKSKKT